MNSNERAKKLSQRLQIVRDEQEEAYTELVKTEGGYLLFSARPLNQFHVFY